MAAPMENETVAQLLVRRLRELGCRAVHGACPHQQRRCRLVRHSGLVAGSRARYLCCRAAGVPGDYSFGLCDAVEADPGVDFVTTASELAAGYAADGYARVNGIGALLTTFGVGELSAVVRPWAGATAARSVPGNVVLSIAPPWPQNAVAGAFAERVPLVCITGSPCRAILESGKHLVVHHSLLPQPGGTPSFDVFARMHEHITGARAMLTPENARAEIERVLSVCTRFYQPVYIAVPADVAEARACGPPVAPIPRPPSDADALAQAVRLTAEWANGAQRPVVLADVGVHRGRVFAELRELLEATNLPCATMMMGRAALDEHHPQHVGIYHGKTSSPDNVRQLIETSDCVLAIGANLTDYNTGGFTAQLDERVMIDVKLNATKVKKARFEDVRSVDLLCALRGALRRRDGAEAAYWQRRDPRDGQLPPPPPQEAPDAPLRTDAILWALQTQLLRPGDLLILETFTIAFSSATMRLPSGVQTFLQALWGSIGFALPAAAGAARAMADARASGRVVLVTGDGSLQMTAAVLGNMLRDGLAPIVLVINNDGYLIERLLCKRPDARYNDIPPWRIAELPRVFGGAPERYHAQRVATAGELLPALRAAAEAQAKGCLAWLEMVTPRMDVPAGASWLSPTAFRDTA